MIRDIHHLLIERAQSKMDLGHPLPVEPREPVAPIIATDRWNITGSTLTKRYEFRKPEDRLGFVVTLMEYELETQHHAVLIVDEDAVIVKLVTKTIDRITELDKEYAKFADVVFRDLAYNIT